MTTLQRFNILTGQSERARGTKDRLAARHAARRGGVCARFGGAARGGAGGRGAARGGGRDVGAGERFFPDHWPGGR